jgi:hypothetical protein
MSTRCAALAEANVSGSRNENLCDGGQPRGHLSRGLDPGGHDAARAIVGDERYCFPADAGWPR